jgi:hypothetical protein
MNNGLLVGVQGGGRLEIGHVDGQREEVNRSSLDWTTLV